MLRIAALLILLATAAVAQTRPQGLMWNRSGLPATLPLQVRSDAGRDYFLTLTRPDTGEAVLAAYVRGGAAFRVLVPPGDYRIALAQGTGWRGEKALFGPETRHIRIAEPLHFGAQGALRRIGHEIDLRGGAEGVRTFGLCRPIDARDAPEVTPRRLAQVAPPPQARQLPEVRRPKSVLPPPDQPPPSTPEGALKPFAHPFVERPRAPIMLPSVPTGQVPQFAPSRPRATARPRGVPRWKRCD
ncbi:hypothetical protein [Paenirhodobacter sp.]|uniref:hypothetical protein n=1 Tax=Paenirhodobacter sp. TaxID=1965326 RepID=UPI003B40308C